MNPLLSLSSHFPAAEAELIGRALREARDTRILAMDDGVRHRTAEFFRAAFGDATAVVVADRTTFDQAGRDVLEGLKRDGVPCGDVFLFPDEVYGEWSFVEMLDQRLQSTAEIPVAVGAGSINDLTKLAAHRQGRQYLSVATAASMDGYTAYGASITDRGSKQTFDCPAPLAVLADLEVIQAAPRAMNASGYADLLAKGAAGADWILADALGEEPLHPLAWSTVQDVLPSWVESPQGVADAQPECLRRLIVGLLMSGFAMQAARSSRPASGAEHQFSHLWDMQHHTYQGAAPSHGFKVGIGTCASLELYRFLLKQDLTTLDADRVAARWPSQQQTDARILSVLGHGELADKAREETRAKFCDRETLRKQLDQVRTQWPEIRNRLTRQIQPFEQTRQMLQAAGSPFEPEQIGISRMRLRDSFEQAWFIRRRYTVLDFVMRAGGLREQALAELFGPRGIWSVNPGAAES